MRGRRGDTEPSIGGPQRRQERARARRRRRVRRMVGAIIRVGVWTLVLAATFVFGLGFGRTIGGDDRVAREQVTITQERGVLTATMPVRTVTSTTTVTVRAPAKRRPAQARRTAIVR